ncbi:hypothetical protein [uncultured Algibacter sp.]|uniref:hypothetical protein n=1 Tax=uncultured Algibacter sp. TaxID=298659 RepID=UPI0026290650|nr:hypothetical protein [uncultured Algibacter sp.]
MGLLIIIACMILLVALLLVPITICIDTISNLYYIKLQGLFKANLEQHETELFRIKLKILFIKYYIYPLKKGTVNKPNKAKKIAVKKYNKRSVFLRLFRVLRTFKTKYFYMNIDTGNCITNAKLYPIIALLNYKGGHYNVNFQGQNQLVLILKNRPINIIKSIINL